MLNMNRMVINQNSNCNPENLLVVKQGGVVTNFIHSRGFSFGKFDMSRFKRREAASLCECGCGRHTNPGSRFIMGHNLNPKGQVVWNKGKTNIYSKETLKKISIAKIGNQNAKGAVRSIEYRRKMSIAKTGIRHTVEARKKMSKIRKGRKHSEEAKRKMSIAKTGIRHTVEARKKMSNSHIGKVLSERTKKKISIATSGLNNPNWQGGIAAEPYCDIWLDKDYKKSIKERDRYKCQNPYCRKNCSHLWLCLHHINYDKKCCDPQNIITLCISCNCRANANREYWTEFYQNIMTEKYGYEYE